MRRLLMAVAVLVMASGISRAAGPVKSSHTVTADTTKSLCGVNKGTNSCIFYGVVVGHGSAGTITIYNSQGAASNMFQQIFTTAAIVNNAYDYTDGGVVMSSGCTYSTTAANQSVNLLYDCSR